MGSVILHRSLRKVFLPIFSGRTSTSTTPPTNGDIHIGSFRNFHICGSNWSETATKPATDGPNSKGTSNSKPKLDPFGIEDIDDRSSTVLVQGFFEQNWEKNKPKPKAKEGQDQESQSQAVEEVNPNIKKYDGWIRSRDVARVREKSAGGAETLRPTSFGGVRLDSDNLVEEDGQFEEHTSTYDGRRFPSSNNRQEHEDGGRLSNPKSMSASDFLKKMKQETGEEIRRKSAQNSDREQQSQVIDRPTTSQLVRRNTNLEDEQARFAKLWGSDALDSNHVPKIYQLPAYNKLTHEEMWGLLRGTVIFQNEFILAINKPSGVPIHSQALDCRHYITQFLRKFADLVKVENIFPLHRLDKETSGVLLFAKDARIAKYLTEKFGLRQVDKKYLVVTKGCPRIADGTIKIPIGQGKVGGTDKYRSTLKPDLREYEIKSNQRSCREAITHFKVLGSIEEAAFLEINLETGVQHQIRIHLGLGLGCPIIGDHKYSHRDKMAPQRLHPHLLHLIKVKQSKVRELPLHLHCNAISFTLPDGASDSAEPVYVHALVPNFFRHTLRAFGLKK